MINRGTYLASIAAIGCVFLAQGLRAAPIEFDNRTGEFPWMFIGVIIFSDSEPEGGTGFFDFLDVTQPPTQSGDEKLQHTMSYSIAVTEWSATEPINETTHAVAPLPDMHIARGEIVSLPNPIFGSIDQFTAPRRFEYGEEVGAEEAFGSTLPVIRSVTMFDEFSRWEWVETHGVMGLQFFIDGQLHYGWLELRPERNTEGGIFRYLPARWAYETTPNTPITVTAPRGDCDTDGDVDLADFGRFQLCFGDDGEGGLSPQCTCADYDGDLDVDLTDFAEFQLTFSGAM